MDLLISSALRSKDWNKEVGGKPYSRHLFGMGLDVIGKDAKEQMDLAEKLGLSLDEDNQGEMTEERVESWCKVLLEEMKKF